MDAWAKKAELTSKRKSRRYLDVALQVPNVPVLVSMILSYIEPAKTRPRAHWAGIGNAWLGCDCGMPALRDCQVSVCRWDGVPCRMIYTLSNPPPLSESRTRSRIWGMENDRVLTVSWLTDASRDVCIACQIQLASSPQLLAACPLQQSEAAAAYDRLNCCDLASSDLTSRKHTDHEESPQSRPEPSATERAQRSAMLATAASIITAFLSASASAQSNLGGQGFII